MTIPYETILGGLARERQAKIKARGAELIDAVRARPASGGHGRREGVAFDIVTEDVALENTGLEDEDEDGPDDASR